MMTDDTTAEQPEQPAPDPEFVALLACPSCHERLASTADALRCEGCGRSYPVRDGVPALLVDEATDD